jgi:hypothetical protein
MTTALAGPYLATVGLLGVAGVAKLIRPVDTAGALRAAGLPASPCLVRVGAAAEVALVALACTAHGPIPPALVALSYASFAVFVGLAVRKGWPMASCGCFGRPDTAPTRIHVALNVAAVLTAVGWGIGGPSSLGGAFSRQPWAGIPLGLAALVMAGLVYLLFTNPLDQRNLRRSIR